MMSVTQILSDVMDVSDKWNIIGIFFPNLEKHGIIPATEC